MYFDVVWSSLLAGITTIMMLAFSIYFYRKLSVLEEKNHDQALVLQEVHNILRKLTRGEDAPPLKEINPNMMGGFFSNIFPSFSSSTLCQYFLFEAIYIRI